MVTDPGSSSAVLLELKVLWAFMECFLNFDGREGTGTGEAMRCEACCQTASTRLAAARAAKAAKAALASKPRLRVLL
jgi:hypothetical protein